ncbi:hypothetical protein FOMPIDRAFT_1049735 [Fomitopsis schrenkii]|uniref:Uncharacterized protein n=1 Tax=Fomitopsis schrenkii TaxID=2126942 RepID=S8FQ32_FOMSC|nr:hypothetical protein FOMPIDRAFT_1049735 [Fomitopsis schrenkii]
MSEQQLDSEFNRIMEKAVAICPRLMPWLEALKKAVVNGPESAMYLPYVKLTNEILAECRRDDSELPNLGGSADLDMVCVCNDPNVVYGIYSKKIPYRKPDVAYIHWRGVRSKGEDAWDWETARCMVEEALGSKTVLDFDWSQALMVDELNWLYSVPGREH